MSEDPAYIFLNKKNTLAALDRTFIGGSRTPIYDLVCSAKFSMNERAVDRLIAHTLTFLRAFPHFGHVDYISAVPSEKEYDLPRALADGVATQLAHPNITPNFEFTDTKASGRKLAVSQKRGNWNRSGIVYSGPQLKNKKILLLDDNYQSGTTMRYISGIMNNHGAMAVFGLTMTKTWSDTDNLGRADEL